MTSNHLRLVLGAKLLNTINKSNKSIGIMKKLSLTLSRTRLLTIYKNFVGPYLDYVDIIYDKRLTESFKDQLEMFQHNVALIINGAIKGAPTDRIYTELGLESLAERRCYRKVIFFHKIINVLSPLYLRS